MVDINIFTELTAQTHKLINEPTHLCYFLKKNVLRSPNNLAMKVTCYEASNIP